MTSGLVQQMFVSVLVLDNGFGLLASPHSFASALG